jgi:hypothetical protein
VFLGKPLPKIGKNEDLVLLPLPKIEKKRFFSIFGTKLKCVSIFGTKKLHCKKVKKIHFFHFLAPKSEKDHFFQFSAKAKAP